MDLTLLPPGLTETEWTVIKATAAGSFIIQLMWFLCWERYYVQTERQRAYILSLLSSGVTSMGSLPYVYQVVYQQRGDLNQLLTTSSSPPFLALLSVALTIFFMTFLCLDLIIGWYRYPSKIDMLTGWVHHITYFCLLSWVLNQHFTGVFIAMCLLEIPTFLLALGSIHSPWRRDYLFASAFLSTRIVFHSFMIASAFRLYRFGPITCALSAFLPVHIYWFFGFIKQQKRLYRQRKLNAAAKPETSTTTATTTTEASVLASDQTSDIHSLSIARATDDSCATTANTSPRASSTMRKRLRPSSSASYMITTTTDRLRRHLPTTVPTDFNFLPYPSPQMIQRLADHLPESISRDLVRSSEKLRGYWDLAYQRLVELQEQQQQNDQRASSPSAPAVAAH
ncbi:hypothetical protein BCR42DRAFT_393241 [Absidia repens]|uniref:TLC domain-domain-containing protein n=1 Tax=Absidia repens TaxID=90262 RepID=A0A1X2IF82_9FUNG|nr:hypothetical protein BCR42DRAFT_393241 [Absidia repens]